MTTVSIANKAPQSILIGGQTVYGMSFAKAIKPVDGTDGDVPIVAGYAFTSNIEKEAWDEWSKRNYDSDLVKRGIVLAHANMNTLKTMVRGLSNQKPKTIPHNWGAARAR